MIWHDNNKKNHYEKMKKPFNIIFIFNFAFKGILIILLYFLFLIIFYILSNIIKLPLS